MPKYLEAATITVDDVLSFTDEPLGDGTFLQIFEMRDMQGNTADFDVNLMSSTEKLRRQWALQTKSKEDLFNKPTVI